MSADRTLCDKTALIARCCHATTITTRASLATAPSPRTRRIMTLCRFAVVCETARTARCSSLAPLPAACPQRPRHCSTSLRVCRFVKEGMHKLAAHRFLVPCQRCCSGWVGVRASRRSRAGRVSHVAVARRGWIGTKNGRAACDALRVRCLAPSLATVALSILMHCCRVAERGALVGFELHVLAHARAPHGEKICADAPHVAVRCRRSRSP